MSFDLLGPKGKWRVVSAKGVCCLANPGGGKTFPTSIHFKKINSDNTDIDIVMEYTGPSFIDQFGNTIAANKPYRFRFKKFFQPINWQVNWFSLDTSGYNPLKTGSLFPPNARVRPIKSEKVNKLDYAWWGGIKGNDGQVKQFITTAEGHAQFTKGQYELSVTWDDAVRVYVDDKLLIDEWNPSKYTFDESPNKKIRLNLDGTHRFRVEHIELGGFATLTVKLNKL